VWLVASLIVTVEFSNICGAVNDCANNLPDNTYTRLNFLRGSLHTRGALFFFEISADGPVSMIVKRQRSMWWGWLVHERGGQAMEMVGRDV
jgi:hypothetical protein